MTCLLGLIKTPENFRGYKVELTKHIEQIANSNAIDKLIIGVYENQSLSDINNILTVLNTPVHIFHVSLPVFVLCLLGWYDATKVTFLSIEYVFPCLNIAGSKWQTLLYVLKAISPSVRTIRTDFRTRNSFKRYSEQFSISERRGILLGGAHLTTDVM